MIDIVHKDNVIYYSSKQVGELDELAIYLDEVFPDAQIKKARWDKELKLNLLEVDIGDDATKKDFNDLLKIYESLL